jgi:large subunit ribosomal protein L17
MRHGDKINNLSRKKAHREALLANLAVALITHKRIETTSAKAKALRRYAEPLINRAKVNDTHNRRMVFAELQDKKAIDELFDIIAPKIANRPGGYTRILKTDFRAGDNADMSIIELVDFYPMEKAGKKADSKGEGKKRTRRAGSGAAKTKAEDVQTAPAHVEDAPAPVADATPEAPAAEETTAAE